MKLYDVIYDWFSANIFVGDSIPASTWEIGGVSMTMSSWLNHTATIAVLVVASILLFGLVIWFGKFVGGLITKVGR